MSALWNWNTGLEVPATVHAARLWLKDLTVADLQATATDEPQPGLVARPYTALFDQAMKRFIEPFHWAAFAYTGG